MIKDYFISSKNRKDAGKSLFLYFLKSLYEFVYHDFSISNITRVSSMKQIKTCVTKRPF